MSRFATPSNSCGLTQALLWRNFRFSRSPPVQLLAHLCHRPLGQLEAAERWYRGAVALRPADASPHMNLGALLHLVGRLREAEAAYLEAWRLGHGQEATRTNLRRLHGLMRARGLEVARVEGLGDT